MQMALDLGAAEDMAWVRSRLRLRFGRAGPILLRMPADQLVKSLISSRTRDEVSLRAFQQLIETYPTWSEAAGAATADIETIIRDVTFPQVKASRLRETLRIMASYRPDFDLAFLGALSVADALAWLERLPGVGRKVSASTLNFSTLCMPAFVIDTHVLRVLRRFGLVPDKADTRTAYDISMQILRDWTAFDLAELHVLIKRLGQRGCGVDRADCRNCPISPRCRARAAA